MKKLTLILCLIPLLSIINCDNDDNGTDCHGIDCLPEATQTGAGTFGCLVNGEPYFALGGVNCQYQLVSGEYFFGVGFPRGVGFPDTISLGTNELSIDEGQTFTLLNSNPGNAFAEVLFEYDNSIPGFIENQTSNQNTGTLTITKLDEQNQIVSGSFEFEILNPEDGQLYQITEGRFDSFYTQ